MRFMVQVRSTEDMEAGRFSDNAQEMFEAMGRFNDGLRRDGWLLDCDGLQPSSKGARIRWTDGKPRVIDGPFAEAKELIAGYWLVEAPSREAVIQRFLESPADCGHRELEIRPSYTSGDVPEGFVRDQLRKQEELRSGKPGAAR